MEHDARHILAAQFLKTALVAPDEVAKRRLSRTDIRRDLIDEIRGDFHPGPVVVVSRRRGVSDKDRVVDLGAITLHRGIDLLVDDLAHPQRVINSRAYSGVTGRIKADRYASGIFAGAGEHFRKSRKPELAL